MIYTKENILKRKSRNEKIKRIIVTVVYVILIPLLCYNISLIIQAVVNPNETPSFFGIKTYVIVSGSMEPELEIGDMIVVKNIDTSELEVGDIISFRQGQSIVTHRISRIIENDGEIEFATKGDNNNAEDSGTISEDLVEGKVVSVIPIIGKVSVLLQNKIVIITVILIIYLYFSNTGNIKRRKRERHRKRVLYEYNREKNITEIK